MKAARFLIWLFATAGCGRFGFDHGSGTPDGAQSNDGAQGSGDADPSGWWDAGWHRRIKLTFNNAGPTLTDVPVMVLLNPARFPYADAQSAGQDVRFIDADGTTLLAYELESWSSTESVVWVRVPQLATGSADFIWLYYNNPVAAAATNGPATWAGYAGVWHLVENPAAGPMRDSTANANDGTAAGAMTAGQQSNGRVGGSLSFDGADDWVAAPHDASLQLLGDLTIMMWVSRNTLGRAQWLCDFSTPMSENEGNNHLYELALNASDNVELTWEYNGGSDTRVTSTTALTSAVGQWSMVAFTRDTTAKQVRFYENGGQLGNALTYVNDATGGTTATLWLAGMVDSTTSKLPLLGRLDEVRIESALRTPAWIAAQHRSMTDALISYGAPESY